MSETNTLSTGRVPALITDELELHFGAPSTGARSPSRRAEPTRSAVVVTAWLEVSLAQGGAVATPAPVWRDALLSTPVDGGRVRCDLCPHLCELSSGESGPCAVRRHRDGRLETAAFSVSVTHLDAVERKPLYHVRPGSRVLTVAGPGCTFRCNYCLNHRISQYGRVPEVAWSAEPANIGVTIARAMAENASIGMSYSEPGLAPELTIALGEAARPSGIPLLWKSNGFLTDRAVDLVAPHLTAVNVDVKAADERAHRKLTGAPLRPVLEAIERFRAHGVWVEVSTPLIPGASDTDDELDRIARHLVSVDPDIPWHLVRFTPDFRMGRHAPTAPDRLRAAADLGREAGLRHVYVERALGESARHTRCAACAEVVVRRGIWEGGESTLVDGACPGCGTPVPGRWS